MRAMMAASLPQNPWLLGTFFLVLLVFAGVLALSLRPGRPQDIRAASELPFQD